LFSSNFTYPQFTQAPYRSFAAYRTTWAYHLCGEYLRLVCNFLPQSPGPSVQCLARLRCIAAFTSPHSCPPPLSVSAGAPLAPRLFAARGQLLTPAQRPSVLSWQVGVDLMIAINDYLCLPCAPEQVHQNSPPLPPYHPGSSRVSAGAPHSHYITFVYMCLQAHHTPTISRSFTCVCRRATLPLYHVRLHESAGAPHAPGVSQLGTSAMS
jgi:hypothetical protein